MSVELKIDTSTLERIARDLDDKVKTVGRRIAFEIEAAAKPMAPVDTSALQNSIYTVTQNEDHFSQASDAAQSARPGVETSPHPQPEGEVIARVGPCVEYGFYQEFGTSRMAAHPFLTPAFEAVTEKYTSGAAWEEIVK